MTLSIATPLLVTFLLATIRAAAWLVVAPPFATKVIPGTVKGLLSIALALPVAGRLTPPVLDGGVGQLIGLALVQVIVGGALGYLTMLAFAAIEAAGNLIDVFGGFTLSSSFDPLSMSQNSVFGKLFQMLAVALLFTLNLHIVVLAGFMHSYNAIPIDAGISMATMSQLATHGLTILVESAAQIAGPLIGVLFLADVGLALMTRVAPSMNVFSLGFPIKMLITLSLVGLTFPELSRVLGDLIDLSTQATLALGAG